MTEFSHNDRHNYMANSGGHRSEKERRFSSYSVKNEKGKPRGDKLNNVKDTAHVKLHCIVEAELLKESRGVVDELMGC